MDGHTLQRSRSFFPRRTATKRLAGYDNIITCPNFISEIRVGILKAMVTQQLVGWALQNKCSGYYLGEEKNSVRPISRGGVVLRSLSYRIRINKIAKSISLPFDHG